MKSSQKSGVGARVAFLILFLVGAGVVLVTTVGPLGGTAMSWPEASLGLVPGGIVFLLFHLLHMRKLGQWGQKKQAAVWWSLATVFLLGLGALMVIGGGEQVSSAESQLRQARSQRRSTSMGSSGYRYRTTSYSKREVEHYETAVSAGWGLLGVSLLFMIGAGVAIGRARSASRLNVAAAPPQGIGA